MPSPAQTIETPDCSIVLRRVEGPLAAERFLLASPLPGAADATAQAEALYRAIVDLLASEGGSFASVVAETVFLRSLDADLASVRSARETVLGAAAASEARPATTEVEQPPLDDAARLLVAVHAMVPHEAPLGREAIAARPACPCPACARAQGLRVQLGDELRLHAAGLYGPGRDAYEQTLGMLALAEQLLERAGMAFGDVVRTWIHLGEMERDYEGLNRGRREFFEARGIDPPPASTGIGGAPPPEGHDLSLALLALRSAGGEAPPVRTVMSTPTLNEAPVYGSDFARGMKVVEANKVALHVSGTASIDETGKTVHVEDFDAQVDRMLVNIETLLEGQGAGFGDVVSAITYLKRPSDAARLREKLALAGFEGFPNALVLAPVCRPELLCEAEALAVLPC